MATIQIPCDSDYGKKPWVARITGTDPKYGYAREFCKAHVTEPGLYVGSAREKDGKQKYYLVMRTDTGELVRTSFLAAASVAEIVGNYLHRVRDIVPQPDPKGREGIHAWRADGRVILREANDRAALEAEKAKLLARLAEIEAALKA